MFNRKPLFLFIPLFIILLLSTLSRVYATSPIDGLKAYPPVHIVYRPAGIQPFTGPDTTALSPSQVQAAYSLPSTGGSGTIAIIDAYDNPSIQNDFNVFSQQYGLPTASATSFEIHKMASSIQNATVTGWEFEECLDVEWAHAIAPNAKILFIECSTNSYTDLLAGVSYATTRSDVVAVSMSWGGSEFSSESTYDYYFVSSYGATFFASAGDDGTQVNFPAVSKNVVGVGGTNLYFNSIGQVTAEIAWNGSGGGLSKYEAEPTFQTTFGVFSTKGFRAVPDVSYNGGSDSYVSVYDSNLPYQGYAAWNGAYGTSAGAPQWAAIRALGGSNMKNSYFYSQASSQVTYTADFRDITSGTNGGSGFYTKATVGYDYVTGLGSPLGNGLLSLGTTPIAGFYAFPTSGYGALTVIFTDTSANNPTSWNWTFGDGGSTTVQNPYPSLYAYYIYNTISAPTSYTVQLIVTNSYGTSTSIMPNYITVNPLPGVEDWMQYSTDLGNTTMPIRLPED